MGTVRCHQVGRGGDVTDKRPVREQLADLIQLVLTEQAQDNGKALDGAELVLVNARQAAEKAADRIIPKLQATVDYHVALASRGGD